MINDDNGSVFSKFYSYINFSQSYIYFYLLDYLEYTLNALDHISLRLMMTILRLIYYLRLIRVCVNIDNLGNL